MKVAVVSESFLPHINGVTGSVLQVLGHLNRTGHQAMIMAPGNPPPTCEGFEVVALPSVGFPGYPQVRVPMVAGGRLVRELSQFGPDVTFLGVQRCDLGDPASYAGADVVVLGAPFDGGTSYRPGARFGPQAVRTTDYLGHDGSRPSLALRTDGLRWIPATNGDFNVPVVTLHTLGDLFVPFKMEQVFNQRAKAKGSDKWLVQRAIRDVGHCAFTAAEATAAFDAMVLWEAGGPKPAGDDVVTPATVAAPTYGCTFTNNTPSTEDFTPPAIRAGFQANYPKCQ